MRQRTLFLLALALGLLPSAPALAGPTGEPSSERIVGGTPTTTQWPAQAYISSPRGSCGGSLVSSRYVLTAGHCVTSAEGNVMSPASFTLTLGRSDLAGATAADRYNVAPNGVTRHGAFQFVNRGVTNDLALLRLSTAAPFEPLRFVDDDEPGLWTPGTVATVLGWGTTCATCPSVQQLRQAGVPVVADATCDTNYAPFPGSFLAATMLCAGSGAADTCYGDSGGPLMVPRIDVWVLAGVTSWGEGCADARYPGVYARLGARALNDWVRNRIPTVAITVTPATPDPRASVTFTASGRHPTELSPTREWDLDDDGSYDDATGSTVVVPEIAAGSHVVRVRDTYLDGDRAFAREVVTTTGSTPPGPPPPPPPPPVTPPTQPTPRTSPAEQTQAPSDAPLAQGSIVTTSPLARLVAVPRRLRLRGLLDRRVAVRVRCYAACALSARLTLDAPSARRIGLAKRARMAATIGRASDLRTSAKSFNLWIELTPRAVKALRRLRRGTLRLRVSARGVAGADSLTRSIAYLR